MKKDRLENVTLIGHEECTRNRARQQITYLTSLDNYLKEKGLVEIAYRPKVY